MKYTVEYETRAFYSIEVDAATVEEARTLADARFSRNDAFAAMTLAKGWQVNSITGDDGEQVWA